MSGGEIRAMQPTCRLQDPGSRRIDQLGGRKKGIPSERQELAAARPLLHRECRTCHPRNGDFVQRAGPATGPTGISCRIRVFPAAAVEFRSESRFSRWRSPESVRMVQAAAGGCSGLGKARPVPVATLRVCVERRCCHRRNLRSARSSGGVRGTTFVPCEAVVPRPANTHFFPDFAMSLG